MDCSLRGFPVLHHLPDFAQTHVHSVDDAIKPSHPLSAPISSRPQSFPASGSFPTSQFFTSGGQSTGVSASASVLPMNIQDWSPLGWTGLISLQSKGLSRVFSSTTIRMHQFFAAQPSSCITSLKCQPSPRERLFSYDTTKTILPTPSPHVRQLCPHTLLYFSLYLLPPDTLIYIYWFMVCLPQYTINFPKADFL